MTTQSEEIVHSQAAHLLYKERPVEITTIRRQEGNQHFSDYGVKLRYQSSIPALDSHFVEAGTYPHTDLVTMSSGKFHTAEFHDRSSLQALLDSGHPQQEYLAYTMTQLVLHVAKQEEMRRGWATPVVAHP